MIVLALVFVVVQVSAVKVHVALKHRNPARLAQECELASSQGRFATLEDIRAAHALPGAADAVLRYLDAVLGSEKRGRVVVGRAGDWLTWEAPSLEIVELAGLRGALPERLRPYVDMVHIQGVARRAKRVRHAPGKGPMFAAVTPYNQTVALVLSQDCANNQPSNTSTLCPDDPDPLLGYVLALQCSEGQNGTVFVKRTQFTAQVVFGFTSYTALVDLASLLGDDQWAVCSVTIVAQYASGSNSAVKSLGMQRFTPSCTPAIFREFYGMQPYSKLAPRVNSSSVALGALYDGPYCKATVDAFFQRFAVPFSTDLVRNKVAENVTAGCGHLELSAETNLDLTCLAVANPQALIIREGPVTKYHDNPSQFEDWVVQIATDPDAALVHSLSYGIAESEFPLPVWQRMELELQKLCIRGITVLVASGDTGASVYACNYEGLNKTLAPDYPATSPYVTAVGGTMFSNVAATRDGASFGEMINCNGTGMVSGAGMSNRSPLPSWQRQLVASYLESGGAPPSQYFNASGRAYPDVVLISHVVDSADGPEDGTSASSPLFAGMVSAINDELLSLGLPVVGWLNPLLYRIFISDPKVFYDVTLGTTAPCPSCQGAPLCQAGYAAAPGFDVASGVGAPYFDRLKKAIVAIQRSKV
jgi:hypothetical protein